MLLPLVLALKAQMLCGVLIGGKVEYVVPTDDKRKLDKPIDCAVHVESGKGMTAFVWVVQGGDEKEAHFGAIAKASDYGAQLKPGADFAACANFEIHARIEKSDSDGGPIWQQTIAVEQACATATKKTKRAPEPVTLGAEWGDGELAGLPDDAARIAVKQFADAVTDSDPPTLIDMVPSSGMKVKKKSYSGDAMRKALHDQGFEKVTGISVEKSCADKVGGGQDCTTGRWMVNAQGKTKLCIYNSISGYGQFSCALFEKRGDRWLWTGVSSYDTGEP
jgi:hypothetical protein